MVFYQVINTVQDDWDLPLFPDSKMQNITPDTFNDYVGRVGLYIGSAYLWGFGFEEIGIALQFDNGKTVGFKPSMVKRLPIAVIE